MTEIIRVENLCKAFGPLRVLRGLSATLREGETTVLLGSSGSGKSTFLRCLNLLEIPSEGRIYFRGRMVGEEIAARVREKPTIHYSEAVCTSIRTQIGMVFQQFNLFPHMTAIENVAEGLVTVLRRPRREAAEAAREQLARVGLADKASEYPARLSGGQKQRVAIARALAMSPKVMLFDEVTSALDPELVGEVLRTMRGLAEEGMTMVVVTHELGFAYHVANHVIFLHEGEIHEAGTPQAVLRQPGTARLREFLQGHSLFSYPGLAEQA